MFLKWFLSTLNNDYRGSLWPQAVWHLSTVADHLQSWQTPANKSTSFDSLYRNVRKPITLSEHFHHQMTFKIFPSILCTHLHYSVMGNNTPRLLQITDAYCHIIFVLLQVLCISKYEHIFRTTANLAWTLVTWSTYQISWKSTCWCKMIRQWHNYSYFMSFLHRCHRDNEKNWVW